MKLDYKIANQILNVNFETGKLFWKKRPESLFNHGALPRSVSCKRWNTRYAGIKIKKKSIHLGSFSDKIDAVNARKLAEKKYGFHPNHGRRS